MVLRSQSDDRLLALARSGHEAAFTVLVERYRSPLIAYARRIVSDSRCEDVVQESFIRAWSALSRETQIADVRAWLYTVVRNAALNARRDGGRISGAVPEDLIAGDDVEHTVERRMRTRDVLAGLGALPGRQREAMVMTAVQGRSGAEAASLLGVSEGAVQQLIHRARGSLRGAATAITPFPIAAWAAAHKAGSVVGAASVGGGAAGGVLSATAAKVVATVAVTGALAGGATQVMSVPPAPLKDPSPAESPHRVSQAAAVRATPVGYAQRQRQVSSAGNAQGESTGDQGSSDAQQPESSRQAHNSGDGGDAAQSGDQGKSSGSAHKRASHKADEPSGTQAASGVQGSPPESDPVVPPATEARSTVGGVQGASGDQNSSG
jgi:RNA polymerase sigma factor (sigma-70 family)